jgi:hypothetical protein
VVLPGEVELGASMVGESDFDDDEHPARTRPPARIAAPNLSKSSITRRKREGTERFRGLGEVVVVVVVT